MKYLIFLVISTCVLGDLYSHNWQVCERLRLYSGIQFQYDLLSNIITLDSISQWIFLILLPIQFMIAFFLIIPFIFYAPFRQSPIEIFTAQLFYETIMSICLFYQGFENYQRGAMLNDSLEGDMLSIMVIFSEFGQQFSMISFFYFILCQTKSSLVTEEKKHIIINLKFFIVCIVGAVFCSVLNITGKNPNGLFGIQYHHVGVFYYGIVVVSATSYLVCGSYTLYKMFENVKKNRKLKEQGQKLTRFCVLYSAGFFIIESIIALFNIIAAQGCDKGQDQDILILYTVSNFITATSLIIKPLYRAYYEPNYRKLVDKVTDFDFLFGKFYNQTNADFDLRSLSGNLSGGNSLTQNELDKEKTQIELTTTQNNLELDLHKGEKSDFNYLEGLQSKIRAGIMFQIVASILIHDKSKKEILHEIDITNVKSDTNIYKEKTIYSIKQETIFQIINVPEQSFFDQMEERTEIKLIAYAPIIFHSIISREIQTVKIQESFEMVANIKRIKAVGKSEGGKSGQTFFFTQDDQVQFYNYIQQFLLKTLTSSELRILLIKLNSYHRYIQTNKDSLIAKIFGIFSFYGQDKKANHLVLMQNVSRCKKSQVLRVYDLKGSSFDREVFKNLSPNSDLSQVILKDIDFLNFEHRLNVSKLDSEKIILNCEADAAFFRSCGLIDYSLILFKVDWGSNVLQFIQQYNIKSDKVYGQHIYNSTTENGIRYHLGIIDYLQIYDLQKKLEKFTKKCLRFNSSLDTSSQDPQKYAARFSRLIKDICR